MAGASATTAAMANFDCDDIYREHAFLVRLTKGREPKALVFEVFGRPPAEAHASIAASAAWAPETVLRCEVPRKVWDPAAPEARAEFNRRLRIEGKPAGRWGADDTAVQRLFGKELLVLLWAIEQSDVALHDDRRRDRPRPSSWHGLAGCATAGAVLWHQTGRVSSGCSCRARLPRTARVGPGGTETETPNSQKINGSRRGWAVVP